LCCLRVTSIPLLIQRPSGLVSAKDGEVYEYLKQGTINGAHEDYLRSRYQGAFKGIFDMIHQDCSAGHEAEFTNYTEDPAGLVLLAVDFKGTLDYIWFSPQVLEVVAITQVDEECELRKDRQLRRSRGIQRNSWTQRSLFSRA
ncbi:Hypothetical protein (Fragment), partial [Durusdinium trenchii]